MSDLRLTAGAGAVAALFTGAPAPRQQAAVVAGLGALAMMALLAGFPARAADCASAMTQREMTECSGAELRAADAELNAVYREAVLSMKQTDAHLGGRLRGAEQALREAQRAWIVFRDKACESYGFLARGGSMEPMLVLNCLTDLTERRTFELKSLATGLAN